VLRSIHYIVVVFEQMNKPEPKQHVTAEECMSDAAHAQLLSARVQLHDGVWLVQDNIRTNDTFMVKLSVCYLVLHIDHFC